jgi:hypothetical protein
MMLTTRKNLGLAVTERGIMAVEVGMSGGRLVILHAAEVPFCDGTDLNSPDKLGKALRRALRQQGFSTSRCVIGLPSSWLAAKEKLLPPTSTDALVGILSIAAERDFASGAQDLVFDYAQTSVGKETSAILVAASRRITEQLSAMADAAGLAVAGMTSSVASLALVTRGQTPLEGRLVLSLSAGGAELAAQSADGLRLLRRFSLRTDSTALPADELVSELRRVLSLLPGQRDSSQAPELLIWNSGGADRSTFEAVAQRLDLPLRLCQLGTDLVAVGPSSAPVDEKFAQAAALASCTRQSLAIDFLHSRLAPRKKAAIGRRVFWASAAAVALIGAGVFLVLDLRANQQEVAALRAQLDDMRDPVAEARELVDNATFARGWYDHRPRFLDCMRQVTLAFPEEGRIWATSLVVHEDMQVLLSGKFVHKDMQVHLSGKSVSEAAALEVLDRLKGDPRIMKVEIQWIRQAGANTREVSFAINFTFRGAG